VKQFDVLPDDVLLEIFDFYVIMNSSYHDDGGKMAIEAWQSLVHVCRRWRTLVLESPLRLNLRLLCTPETPVKDTLDIWPALPLIVRGNMALSLGTDTDNIIAALGQSNRVRQVYLLNLADWQLENVLAEMQVPFPELTDLRLFSNGETLPVIPDSFLGRSAPRLRYFELFGIPFPGLPKLRLSANHLVELWLANIPHSGYISPEAMAALITVLSSLETLSLGFQSPQSCPGWESRSLPPPKRSMLPALHEFRYKGVTEYLEDLVTHIDTPELDRMQITFFNQIDFDCGRLARFLNCTPTLRALNEAHVQFCDYFARVGLPPGLEITISCREPDWQLSSVAQVCNPSLHPLSTVEDLYIEHEYSEPVWKNDAIENTLWLELLLPFTAVENLYLSKEFAPSIAATLQELVWGGRTEVLPSLQNIFVEGLRVKPSAGNLEENIWQFATSQWRPIAVSVWM
jgi:hypothetical protein